jgi:hypothetical protein
VLSFARRYEVLALAEMGGDGKARAAAALDGLQTGGCTNLWDGILKGMEMLDGGGGGGDRKKFMFVLTDGVPNVNPPKGVVEMLRDYKDAKGGEGGVQVNTFGFGYAPLLPPATFHHHPYLTFRPHAGTTWTRSCC